MAYNAEHYLVWIPSERRAMVEEEVRKGTYLPKVKESPDGIDPNIAMREWESNGVPIDAQPVTDRMKLCLYYDGKLQRDFHIQEWLSAVKTGLFEPEEFLECLGLDIAEFHSVFKRYPDLRRWRFLQTLKDWNRSEQ
jgi:hypothetical protein